MPLGPRGTVAQYPEDYSRGYRRFAQMQPGSREYVAYLQKRTNIGREARLPVALSPQQAKTQKIAEDVATHAAALAAWNAEKQAATAQVVATGGGVTLQRTKFPGFKEYLPGWMAADTPEAKLRRSWSVPSVRTEAQKAAYAANPRYAPRPLGPNPPGYIDVEAELRKYAHIPTEAERITQAIGVVHTPAPIERIMKAPPGPPPMPSRPVSASDVEILAGPVIPSPVWGGPMAGDVLEPQAMKAPPGPPPMPRMTLEGPAGPPPMPTVSPAVSEALTSQGMPPPMPMPMPMPPTAAAPAPGQLPAAAPLLGGTGGVGVPLLVGIGLLVLLFRG